MQQRCGQNCGGGTTPLNLIAANGQRRFAGQSVLRVNGPCQSSLKRCFGIVISLRDEIFAGYPGVADHGRGNWRRNSPGVQREHLAAHRESARVYLPRRQNRLSKPLVCAQTKHPLEGNEVQFHLMPATGHLQSAFCSSQRSSKNPANATPEG